MAAFIYSNPFTAAVKHRNFVQGNSWVLFPAFILSIGLLIALQVKRKETPTNLILLAAFTVVEAYTVGMTQWAEPHHRCLFF